MRVALSDGTTIDVTIRRPSAWQASVTAALAVATAVALLTLVLRELDRTSMVLPPP